MVIRLFAAATALLLGFGVSQAREATAPAAPTSPAAATIDPLEVPRGIQDWFAKTVDGFLTDDEPAAKAKPHGNR